MWCKFLQDIYLEYFFLFLELAGSNFAQTLLNPPTVGYCKVCLQVPKKWQLLEQSRFRVTISLMPF